MTDEISKQSEEEKRIKKIIRRRYPGKSELFIDLVYKYLYDPTEISWQPGYDPQYHG